MKKLLLILISLFMISAAYAVDVCSEKVACVNQDGKEYCVPGDSSCELSVSGYEIEVSYSDTDEDGWTEGCDAFPDDSSEQMDIDGDGVGHNADCDDFDASIGECEEPEEETPPTPSTSGGSSNGGGSRSSSGASTVCKATWTCTDWGACINGKQTRYCTVTNACEQKDDAPATTQSCSSNVILAASPGNNATNSTNTTQQEVSLFENVIPTVPQTANPFIGMLLTLLIVILGLLLFLIAKKKEKAHKQTLA